MNIRNVTEKDLIRALSTPCATLDKKGTVPDAQVAGQVTDVLEFATRAGFPAEGSKGKFYVDKETGKAYEWNGTEYVESPDTPEFIRRMGVDLARKADKVASATSGNLAALDSSGNLTDSGKDPVDFVQIGETNIQQGEFDVALGPQFPPLFTAVAGYDDPMMGGWTQYASADFGAEVIQMARPGMLETTVRPGEVVVEDEVMTNTSTMTGSSVETPLLYVGSLWGQNGSGIGDIELNEYCSVHSPYDEMNGGYAFQISASAIIKAGSDYEAGTLGPLLDIGFNSGDGTIGYPNPDTGDTTWATVQYIVSAANGWSDGFPVVYALTVDNSGTLALNGGSIEFVDSASGTSYYLGVSDAIHIGSLNTGYWVYNGYDPSTGDYSEQQIDAASIAYLLSAYNNNGIVKTGWNQVPQDWGNLFSVADASGSYDTIFTGRTVEIGGGMGGGGPFTIVSDSGVTAPGLELNDGGTSVTLSPSELQQLKALIQNAS